MTYDALADTILSVREAAARGRPPLFLVAAVLPVGFAMERTGAATFLADTVAVTPFSHKANLLVMGAGGYKSSDYLKVGKPLTVLLFVLLTWLVPVFFPF